MPASVPPSDGSRNRERSLAYAPGLPAFCLSHSEGWSSFSLRARSFGTFRSDRSDQLLAAREWDNVWTAISESPLLRPADVAAASVDDVSPYSATEDKCFVGVDLSVVKDKTSIVVLAYVAPEN